MRMMGKTDDVLFVDIQSSLELAGCAGEAVQNFVLTNAINEFAEWRDDRCDKVTALAFTR